MLTTDEQHFREFVIRYRIMEGLQTSSPIDRETDARIIRQELEFKSTRDLAIMAHEDGLIDSTDDIYMQFLR